MFSKLIEVVEKHYTPRLRWAPDPESPCSSPLDTAADEPPSSFGVLLGIAAVAIILSGGGNWAAASSGTEQS